MKHNVKIGYVVSEDCQLNYHNFEAGEEIIIADHCEDNDWPGTDWYDLYPQIFSPLYAPENSNQEPAPAPPVSELPDEFTKGEWEVFVQPTEKGLATTVVAGHKRICTLSFVGIEQTEANAILIASAPQLQEHNRVLENALRNANATLWRWLELEGGKYWDSRDQETFENIQTALNSLTTK